jgi:2-C-methyl-D-erythritol 4-phosphate cytidylyltransferase
MLHATACRKATIHIYSLKKFQKIQKFIAIIVACPRMQKPILVNNVLSGL